MSTEAVIANQIIDASTVGKNALTAVDAAAFRAAIGADTTYLALAGGTLTGALSLGSNAITSVGAITSSGSLTVGTASSVIWSARGALRTTTANQFRFSSVDASTGFILSTATNNTVTALSLDGTAPASLTCGAITVNSDSLVTQNTKLNFASTSHQIFSDNSNLFAESTGDIYFRRGGTANARINQTHATTSLRGVWSTTFCVTTGGATTAAAYIQSSGTDCRLKADGGTKIRNLADTADADLTARAGSFSASVTALSVATSTLINTGTLTLPTSTDTLVGRATTDTLTNKRIQKRVSSTTSAASLTPDISAADFYEYTALAAGLTISNPTGSPVNGELLNFRLQDNGTGRALTWGAQFRSMTATLPTTTVANKTHRVLCEWNSGDSTWDCLAVSAQP